MVMYLNGGIVLVNLMKIKMVIIICMFTLAACTINNKNVIETKKTLENEVTFTDFEHKNEVSTNDIDKTFNEMIFAEKSIFENLKEQYNLIEFSGEFEVGDIEKYDYYIEKFYDLLNNNQRFFIENTKEEFLFSEYNLLQSGTYDLNNYVYIFFDVDNDKEPELGVIDVGFSIHIFKYILSKDEFILWKDLSPSYYRLNGSLKARYNRGGTSHIFFTLDENGEMKEIVSFFIMVGPETIYIVSVPKNIDNLSFGIQENKKDAYYVEEDDSYYFRVKEEEFNQLTEDYFEAEKIAEKGIKDVSFSYDELFGKLAQERNEAANAIETNVCVEDSADNTWKEAYSTFLNNFQRDSQYNRSHFSWRDLDNDGIPELIIEQARDDAGILNVYSYDGCVFEVGKYSNPKIGVADLRFSTNPDFSGLFTFWWGGGVEHYGYLTVNDRELLYVDLWYIDRLNETNQIEVSSDKELINESISVETTDDSILEMYPVDAVGISELTK